MTAPVLLWGSPRDIPLAAVCTALSRLGTPMFFVDQTRVRDTALSFTSDGAGWLRIGGQACDLGRVRSAYVRPEASASITRAEPSSAAWQHAADIDDAMASWLESTPALVVNRLSAMASNGSKPYQAALIREAGFRVPDTLLTNDASALRQFQSRHGSLVYKSASGVRSIVSRLDSTDEARLSHLSTCPTQFQQFIAGVDHRVHVIGEDIFGHRIESDADDYRYAASGAATVRSWPVPDSLAERLRGLTRSLGLRMSGIDLRLDSNGDWVCFEVNPSPGFSFFETEDDQPLAQATARLLSEAGATSTGTDSESTGDRDGSVVACALPSTDIRRAQGGDACARRQRHAECAVVVGSPGRAGG